MSLAAGGVALGALVLVTSTSILVFAVVPREAPEVRATTASLAVAQPGPSLVEEVAVEAPAAPPREVGPPPAAVPSDPEPVAAALAVEVEELPREVAFDDGPDPDVGSAGSEDLFGVVIHRSRRATSGFVDLSLPGPPRRQGAWRYRWLCREGGGDWTIGGELMPGRATVRVPGDWEDGEACPLEVVVFAGRYEAVVTLSPSGPGAWSCDAGGCAPVTSPG